MSYRPELAPFQIITDGDMSGDITSNVTVIQKLSMLSYQYTWTGSSPVGAVSVEVSNTYSLNPDGSVKNAGRWDPLILNVGGSPDTSIPVTGNSGSGIVDIDAIGFYAIRTKFTAESGTGTLQAWINGKVA